jgi:hypothetical protein
MDTDAFSQRLFALRLRFVGNMRCRRYKAHVRPDRECGVTTLEALTADRERDDAGDDGQRSSTGEPDGLSQ